MTYDEIAKDCDRFIESLRANGKRPVALILYVCDDHDNSDALFRAGNNEQVIDAAMATILDVRGMKAVYK